MSERQYQPRVLPVFGPFSHNAPNHCQQPSKGGSAKPHVNCIEAEIKDGRRDASAAPMPTTSHFTPHFDFLLIVNSPRNSQVPATGTLFGFQKSLNVSASFFRLSTGVRQHTYRKTEQVVLFQVVVLQHFEMFRFSRHLVNGWRYTGSFRSFGQSFQRNFDRLAIAT